MSRYVWVLGSRQVASFELRHPTVVVVPHHDLEVVLVKPGGEYVKGAGCVHFLESVPDEYVVVEAFRVAVDLRAAQFERAVSRRLPYRQEKPPRQLPTLQPGDERVGGRTAWWR